MIGSTVIRERVFETPGYSADLCLSPDELDFFRVCIKDQWLSRIAAHYPEHEDRFRELGLERYHELSHLLDHRVLWGKESRLLPQQAVERLLQFPFLKKLADVFGNFSISDVVYGDTIVGGQQEIYWRIVRPEEPGDVGPIHADQWFHNVLGAGSGMFPQGVKTVKVWIPIYCEPAKSGLLVVPDSHKNEWRHGYVEKEGFKKPVILEDVDTLGCKLVPTSPGTLLMFNDRLLHGGAVNRGDITRVSCEITLVLCQS